MADDELVEQETQRAAAEAARIAGHGGPRYDDPAEQAVREAGGGEAEGFEDAEAALIDHAQHGDYGHSPLRDAFTPERESDEASSEYGEADEERSSETGDDR